MNSKELKDEASFSHLQLQNELKCIKKTIRRDKDVNAISNSRVLQFLPPEELLNRIYHPGYAFQSQESILKLGWK